MFQPRIEPRSMPYNGETNKIIKKIDESLKKLMNARIEPKTIGI